jgi:hypothetical protein
VTDSYLKGYLGPVLPTTIYHSGVFIKICGARARIILLRTVFSPVSISGYVQGLRALKNILSFKVLRIY